MIRRALAIGAVLLGIASSVEGARAKDIKDCPSTYTIRFGDDKRGACGVDSLLAATDCEVSFPTCINGTQCYDQDSNVLYVCEGGTNWTTTQATVTGEVIYTMATLLYAGQTVSTIWTKATDAIIWSNRQTVSDYLTFKWASVGAGCGGVDAEIRLQKLNGIPATLLTLTQDATAAFEVVYSADAAITIPAADDTVEWQVRYSGACGDTLFLLTAVAWEVQ